MQQARSCSKCGGAMEYRLGNFDCPDCGHSVPAGGSGGSVAGLQGAGPQLTDASAAYKLLQREKKSTPQNIAEDNRDGRYNQYAKPPPKPDKLRDEKITVLVIACAGIGYGLYYWLTTSDG